MRGVPSGTCIKRSETGNSRAILRRSERNERLLENGLEHSKSRTNWTDRRNGFHFLGKN